MYEENNNYKDNPETFRRNAKPTKTTVGKVSATRNA